MAVVFLQNLAVTEQDDSVQNWDAYGVEEDHEGCVSLEQSCQRGKVGKGY